ncbi:MAG: VWA domain-containing protein, partial [Deltaproteobacteria bacterium]|nr:VWA domain-containing protein [Deltaproteobacteria bacterium]
AALVMAVARPMPVVDRVQSDVARKLLLVIDHSASMAYEFDGKTLLEHAKTKATDLVTHLEPGDAVSLVIAGEKLETPFQAPSLDHQAVRSRIAKIELSKGSADLGSAMEQALAQVPQGGEGVVLAVVGDLAASNFANVQPTTLVPAPEIRLIDAAGRTGNVPLANVAIESLAIETTGLSPRERRFTVGLRNYGAEPVSRCGLSVRVGDDVKQRGYVSIAPQSQAEKVLTLSFDEAGYFTGEIRLQGCSGDGFSQDDSFYFVVDISPEVSVLAVNGDPRSRPYDDELFFLERALDAIPAGDARINLKMVTAGELAQEPSLLNEQDVVLLANVAELSPEVVESLTKHVGDGGGLFLTLGNQIGFEAMNETLKELLPHPLRDLHREADPVLGAPPVGLTDLQREHPIFSGMDLAFELGLKESKTRSYFNLAVGSGIHARPLMRFSNGAPALVEATGELAGRVMLLTTSIDLGLTDLALRPSFPAFLQRTIRYLGRAVMTGYRRIGRVGENIEVNLPTASKAMEFQIAESEPIRVPRPADGESAVRVAGLRDAGIYRVRVLEAGWSRQPALDLAMNPSLLESDFTPVEPEQVAQAMGAGTGDQVVSVALSADGQSDPFEARGYASLALLCLGCFFLTESILASRG